MRGRAAGGEVAPYFPEGEMPVAPRSAVPRDGTVKAPLPLGEAAEDQCLHFRRPEQAVAQRWEVRAATVRTSAPLSNTPVPPRVIPEIAQRLSEPQKAQQRQRIGWVPVLASGQTGMTDGKDSRKLIRRGLPLPHIKRILSHGAVPVPFGL